MLKLSSPITDVSRIGPAKAKLLKKLSITHVRDLLYAFPRRYDDFSNITPIAQLQEGKAMTVQGKVTSVKSEWGWRGRRKTLRIFAEIEDETGVLSVTWYNLQFLARQLWRGRPVFVAGTVERLQKNIDMLKKEQAACSMRSPVLEFAGTDTERIHTGRITPVYSETAGVTSRFLRYQIKALLPLVKVLPEYVPDDIRARHKLMGIHEALRIIHFPESQEKLDEAQRRLRFDELFFLQLAALVRRRSRQQQRALSITLQKKEISEFRKKLPFTLTKAQQRVIQEVFEDLKKDTPMNRLLQGDVGSGKSAVAQIAAQATLSTGFKVLYLAPTEILARQQAESFAAVLGKQQTALLIGALEAEEKSAIKQKLQKGKPLCVIGTHALLQKDVIVKNLALTIIDEQHRFGVRQRFTLTKSLTDKQAIPHLLSMTATPIPRTLNLTIYGDLDLSVIDEMPPGRKPVKTVIVPQRNREEVIIAILAALHKGRQAYVIAPLVEDSPKMEVKSAKTTAQQMQHLFPGIAVSLVHGQMKSAEKEAIMRNFNAGALQLLVATAVVEVGVNVPNATHMIIEGAERFGLSQLHQFRGRIGRGEHQSYCYLFPTTDEAADNERLKALVRTNDGFKIAEEDLLLRGPGEAYGVAQSGFSDLKVASLLDYATIKITRTEAQALLNEDPGLEKYPILKKKTEQKNLQTHFE